MGGRLSSGHHERLMPTSISYLSQISEQGVATMLEAHWEAVVQKESCCRDKAALFLCKLQLQPYACHCQSGDWIHRSRTPLTRRTGCKQIPSVWLSSGSECQSNGPPTLMKRAMAPLFGSLVAPIERAVETVGYLQEAFVAAVRPYVVPVAATGRKDLAYD